MLAGVKSFVSKAVSPAFYKAQYWKVVADTNKEIRQNSIRPLFKMMILTAIGMKSFQYYVVGRKLTTNICGIHVF